MLDAILEIGGHLEQFAEIGVALGELVIERRLADDDHLDVERYGFGLEAAGVHHAVRLGEGLDPYAPAAQGLLEGVVGQWLLQQLAPIEDQIAAVGAVQGAALDQGEIGDQGAHPRNLFDLADQPLVGRVILINHRRTLQTGAVDQDIHAIALDAGLLGLKLRRRRWCFAGGRRARHDDVAGREGFVVFHHILAHRVEIADHVVDAFICIAHLVDEMAGGVTGDVSVEFAHPLASVADQPREFAQGGLQQPLQGIDGLLNTTAIGFGECLESLGFENFAVLHRREAEAGGGAQQGDAAFSGFLLNLGDDLFVALLDIGFDSVALAAVFIALEGRRDDHVQTLQEPRHIGLELAAEADGQAQGARLL